MCFQDKSDSSWESELHHVANILQLHQVLDSHPDEVARYQNGKKELLNFFIGKLMAATGGQASPEKARMALLEALSKG